MTNVTSFPASRIRSEQARTAMSRSRMLALSVLVPQMASLRQAAEVRYEECIISGVAKEMPVERVRVGNIKIEWRPLSDCVYFRVTVAGVIVMSGHWHGGRQADVATWKRGDWQAELFRAAGRIN
jgi:hypothetical protein